MDSGTKGTIRAYQRDQEAWAKKERVLEGRLAAANRLISVLQKHNADEAAKVCRVLAEYGHDSTDPVATIRDLCQRLERARATFAQMKRDAA